MTRGSRPLDKCRTPPPAHTIGSGLRVAEKALRVANKKKSAKRFVRELSRIEEISMRILHLRKAVLAPPRIASHLERVAAANVGEGVQQLVVILIQRFREVVAVSQIYFRPLI